MMSTQRKIANRTISAQDREFEELLRRAALYAKAQSSTGVRVRGAQEAPQGRVSQPKGIRSLSTTFIL
jgi:hypothetical protein